MIIGLGMHTRLLDRLELSAKVLTYQMRGVCSGRVHRWCTDLLWEHLNLTCELAFELADL